MAFKTIPDTARVTVCNACLRMACVEGDLKCQAAQRETAGVVKLSVGELRSRGSSEKFAYWEKPKHA